MRLGNCPNPVVAAVGAGGGYGGEYGGAGSGHVEYRANLSSKAFTQMLVHVGSALGSVFEALTGCCGTIPSTTSLSNRDGDSLVTDLSDGSVVLRAKKGEDNDGTSGGAGYSGGGGGGYGPPSAYGGAGGSDGSSGGAGNSGQGGIAGYGGSGSGFDVSQIPPLRNFALR